MHVDYIPSCLRSHRAVLTACTGSQAPLTGEDAGKQGSFGAVLEDSSNMQIYLRLYTLYVSAIIITRFGKNICKQLFKGEDVLTTSSNFSFGTIYVSIVENSSKLAVDKDASIFFRMIQ